MAADEDDDDPDNTVGQRRSEISRNMWESYQEYLSEHGPQTEEEIDNYLDLDEDEE